MRAAVAISNTAIARSLAPRLTVVAREKVAPPPDVKRARHAAYMRRYRAKHRDSYGAIFTTGLIDGQLGHAA